MAICNLRGLWLRQGVWMSYFDDAVAVLERFEGCVPWMYLDTVGVVTLGVGFAMFHASDVAALTMMVDGRKATVEEITADFARVLAMPKGMPAARYKCATSPELSKEDIAAKLVSYVHGCDTALGKLLQGYNSIEPPFAPRVALIDMAYNLGVGKLAQFTHLKLAVYQHDWEAAAAACHRIGPSDERNEWTKQMFLSAV